MNVLLFDDQSFIGGGPNVLIFAGLGDIISVPPAYAEPPRRPILEPIIGTCATSQGAQTTHAVVTVDAIADVRSWQAAQSTSEGPAARIARLELYKQKGKYVRPLIVKEDKERIQNRCAQIIENAQPGDNQATLMAELVMQSVTQLREATEAYLHELETEIVELKSKPELRYIGTWSPDTVIPGGSFVTYDGCVFYCRRDSIERPGRSDDFQLAVKSGRDGKNGKDGNK